MKKLSQLIIFGSHDICCNESVETALICTVKERKNYDEETGEVVYNFDDQFNKNTNLDSLDLLLFYRIKSVDEYSLNLLQKRFPNFQKYTVDYAKREYFGTICPYCKKNIEPTILDIHRLDEDYYFEELGVDNKVAVDGYYIAIDMAFVLSYKEEFPFIDKIPLFKKLIDNYSNS